MHRKIPLQDVVRHVGRHALVLLVGWTLLLSASLFWNFLKQGDEQRHEALVMARISLERDILYRRWNASHGGVYVPVSGRTEPNPYLAALPERDLTTPSGRSLTLVNPAFMTRQVYELADRSSSLRAHLTSLRPLRPENRADAWETEALEAFETGHQEFFSIVELDGQRSIRLMRPFRAEKPCLECHAVQGYREGDIRGGLSVSIPLSAIRDGSRAELWTITMSHCLIWALGVAMILGGSFRLGMSMERKSRTRDALARSEDRFRSLSDSSPLGVLETDGIGRCLYANPRWVEIVGPCTQSDGSDGWLKHLHDEDRESFACLLSRARQARKSFQQDLRIVKPDGEVAWLSFHSAPFGRGQNLADGFVCTAADITRRKSLEREIIRARKLEATGALAGGVAHDFNNILGIVLANVSMAKMHSDSHDAAHAYLESAEQATLRGQELARRFLAFSGAGQTSKECLVLDNLVRDAVTLALAGSGRAPQLDFREGSWPVGVDREQISQMVYNLATNAAEATRSGGTIRVMLKNIHVGDETPKPLQFMKTGRYVRMTVADTGKGIQPEHLDHVFNPYFSTKDSYDQKGLGMGLSIVEATVRKHDGYITIKSCPREGTEVSIFLPAAPAERGLQRA